MINEPDPPSPLIYTLTALSCIGGFLFGYDTGVISGALVQISDKFDLSDWEKELVVSITVAGALVAASLCGPISDHFGRRPVVLVSSVIFTIGAILMACAQSYSMLLVGRFIVGLGVGAASGSMPVFVSEAAPADKRGVLVTCVNLAVTGGQFVAAVVSGAFITTQGGWRYMVGLAALPSMVQLVGFLFLPESPRWLLENGLVDQAIASLRTLRGCDDVREEVQDILRTIDAERGRGPKKALRQSKYSTVGQSVHASNDEVRLLFPINEDQENGRAYGGGGDAPFERGDDSEYDDDDSDCDSEDDEEECGQEGKGNADLKGAGSAAGPVIVSPLITPAADRTAAAGSNSSSNASGNARAVISTPGTGEKAEELRQSASIGRNSDGSDCLSTLTVCFSNTAVTWRAIMADPTIRRALLLGCALQAAQQIGGINTVMYYTATILKLAGFSSNAEAVWLSAAVAFCNFSGTIAGLRFVDSVGRRSLTLTSLGAVALVLLAIAVAFYEAQQQSPEVTYGYTSAIADNSGCSSYTYCFDCVQDDGCGFCSDYVPTAGESGSTGSSACIAGDDDGPTNASSCSSADYYATTCPGNASATVGWLIFMLLCLYLLAFAPGMGSMPWCINSEIYPTSVRGMANSIATTINWATNFAMSASFLTLMNVATRPGAFIIYSGISALFLVFFYFYLPETKGRELEEIRVLFSDRYWGKASSAQGARRGGRKEGRRTRGSGSSRGRRSKRSSSGTNSSRRQRGGNSESSGTRNPLMEYSPPYASAASGAGSNKNKMSIAGSDGDAGRVSILSAGPGGASSSSDGSRVQWNSTSSYSGREDSYSDGGSDYSSYTAASSAMSTPQAQKSLSAVVVTDFRTDSVVEC